MAVNAPPTRRPALTRLDEELLARLLQQAQTPQEAYIRESALGVPWGSLANSLVGGMLAGRERRRQEEKIKRQDDYADAVTRITSMGTELMPGQVSISPQGTFETLPTDVEGGGVSTFTRPETYGETLKNYKSSGIAEEQLWEQGIPVEDQLAAQFARDNLNKLTGKRVQGVEATTEAPLGIPYAPQAATVTVGEEFPEDSNELTRFLSGKEEPVTLNPNANIALSQALRGADVNELEFRDYMQNRMATKQGEEKYESSFIANIFNAEGDNFVGRISEKTITNSDGSKTKIAEIYNPNTNSYIALTPGFNYSKIADKKNEIQPRYFTYNGEVDIEYTDTDGQTKILKPNDSFRIEGPNSPQALINLSKTQNAEEKKLVGDKGFASRPLVDINNPGIVVASINGIIGGTGNYEESIQIRENYEIPYKDENNVDQVYTYQAGESINNKDERFMPLLNLLQETTIGNISEMRKAGFISAPKLLEQRNDLLQQGQSINSLINYVDTIDQTSTGINRTIDRVNTWFTSTFMPENQLDENEVALRIANGQLSRLGGTQRVDILGPGVMTEFDFLRLQEALGGEPTSKQSIQAFKRTLKLILEEKMVKYNDSLKVYDAQRTKFGDLRAEVIPPINFEVKEYKSFFEPTDYPSWNTGMIKRIEKGDAIFNQIAEVQKLVGTNATNEDYLKFFNKRQWEEIKARLRLLGIKGVPK